MHYKIREKAALKFVEVVSAERKKCGKTFCADLFVRNFFPRDADSAQIFFESCTVRAFTFHKNAQSAHSFSAH